MKAVLMPVMGKAAISFEKELKKPSVHKKFSSKEKKAMMNHISKCYEKTKTNKIK